MSRSFGIDLGTTNSAICTMDEYGMPLVITNAEGAKTTPSVVQVRSDGSMLVGDLARREIVLEKENTAHFFKRDIGMGATYEYHGRPYTPVDLSAAVLRKLKNDAEEMLGEPVVDAVITVPAYFQNAAREETRQAAQLAGLNVLQMINEPTAAAIAYAFAHGRREETILVYDLGGGTFDISLVRITPALVEVLGTDGNHALGGKDWDDRLLQYVGEQFQERHGTNPLDDPILYQELLGRAEDAKKNLATSQKAVVSVFYNGVRDRIEITRDTFESITADLLAQTATLIEQLLEGVNFPLRQVDSMLLAGGSTRMPACRRLVSETLGKPLNLMVNPDECVAIGAALQAAASSPGTLLLGTRRVQDVMAHSMGMIAESEDGSRFVNSILICRNQPIPAQHIRPFEVSVRGGRPASSAVYVTQGESPDPADCSFAGKYSIEDIPVHSSGTVKVRIRYEYDSDGVVVVSASLTDGQPLRVVRQAMPDDMSWVFGDPRSLALTPEPVTVYAAVDLSGSMSGQPLEDSKQAVRQFIHELDLEHVALGLIEFADKINVSLKATHKTSALRSAVDAWRVSDSRNGVGYGNEAHPFDSATKLLHGVSGRRTLVVLTDGRWDDPQKAVAAAKRLHAEGVEVIAIGFGSADQDFLRQIATSMDQSTLLRSSADLSSAFEQVAREIGGGGMRRL